MPLRHSAFLLDYRSFQQQMNPFLQDVERGDYGSLYGQAEQIVKKTSSKKWILQDHGTLLEPIAFSNDANVGELGYWLLIVLSTYLAPAPSIRAWGTLQRVLTHIGWSDETVWQLLRGQSPALLLKPELVDTHQFIAASDPYWYWIIPLQAYQRGWLSVEQISEYTARLIEVHDALFALSETELERAQDHHSQAASGSLKHLHAAYQEALTMLEVAQGAAQGLFMIIS